MSLRVHLIRGGDYTNTRHEACRANAPLGYAFLFEEALCKSAMGQNRELPFSYGPSTVGSVDHGTID